MYTFNAMKRLYLLILVVGAIVCSCEKDPNAQKYSVTINKTGYGTVTISKSSGIDPGGSVTITATPNHANSLYSIFVNNSQVTFNPTDKEFKYTIESVNSDQVVDVYFTNSANILISTITNQSPWVLTALNFFRYDGAHLHSIVLNRDLIEYRYFYFNYPNTSYMEAFNSDGLRLIKTNWEIFINYTYIDSQPYTILELTGSKLVLNAPLGVSPSMSSQVYAQYTFERE